MVVIYVVSNRFIRTIYLSDYTGSLRVDSNKKKKNVKTGDNILAADPVVS